MWDRLTKTAIENIVAIIIIIGCFSLAILSAVHKISPESQSFISNIVSPAMVGVIGWLYTKNNKN